MKGASDVEPQNPENSTAHTVFLGVTMSISKVSGTKNEGTEPYKAILGVGFPYISLIKLI